MSRLVLELQLASTNARKRKRVSAGTFGPVKFVKEEENSFAYSVGVVGELVGRRVLLASLNIHPRALDPLVYR